MIIRILCLFLIVLVSQGCRRENKNPETLDPIYSDILKDMRGVESFLAESEKKVEEAQKELAKTAPRSLERKTAQRDLEKHQDKVARIKEYLDFLKIRAERRRVEGRAAYKRAFINKEEWPDPKEFESYLVNKRLMHASKNWNDRVPKTKHNDGSVGGVAGSAENAQGTDTNPGNAGQANSGH